MVNASARTRFERACGVSCIAQSPRQLHTERLKGAVKHIAQICDILALGRVRMPYIIGYFCATLLLRYRDTVDGLEEAFE